MKHVFTTEATIDAPVEEVWATLTDWAGAPRWMAGIDSLAADGPTRPGTSLTFLARGRERTATIRVVDDGRRVVVRSIQGPVTADYEYALSPIGDARTELRLDARCRLRGPVALAGPLVRRTLRRTDGGQPEALREVVELG